MAIAQSKVNAQGRVSIPAEVRQRLGISPGATLEWADDQGQIVVRRAGRYSSEDIHEAVFEDDETVRHSVSELDAGIARHLRRKHARD